MNHTNICLIAKKELKESFNSPMPYIFSIVFFLLLGWFLTSSLFLIDQASMDEFFASMPYLLIFFLPAFTMRLFAEEYKTGTIESLATLPLRDTEIVLGKYKAAIVFWGLMLLASVFYMAALMLLGSPDTGQIMAGYLGALLLGGFYSAIGLFASSLTKSQVIAFLLGFVFCFVFFLFGKAAHFIPGTWGALLAFLGIDSHFHPFLKGVVDSRDILYFISGQILFLAGTLYSFNSRRMNKQLYLIPSSGIMAVAAIVVMTNLFSQKLFMRWDWTEDGRYSLSHATDSLIHKLEDPLYITFYSSEGLPQPHGRKSQYIRNLLQEYHTMSRGIIHINTINPDVSEDIKIKCRKAGIDPADFNQITNDQLRIRKGFMGMVLNYQDKQDKIPYIKDINRLEYDISSRIKHLVSRGKKKLVFLAGHGELSPHTLKYGLSQRLHTEFDVEYTRLSKDPHVQPDVLFLVGPQNPFSQEEINLLDNWIGKGIPLAVFLNAKAINKKSFTSFPNKTGLLPLLTHYGIQVENDFVLDSQCQKITVQSRQASFALRNAVHYPVFVLSNNLNKKHFLTQSIDVLSFPFVHPLTLTAAKTSQLKTTILAKSSDISWFSPGLSSLEPYALPNPKESDPKGPFVLAAMVQGSTTSFANPHQHIEAVKIAVVGTSFFADPNMPHPDGNVLFLVSLAQWMSQDAHFLAIPTRGESFKPLKHISNFWKPIIKYYILIFLPLMILICGIFYWHIRQVKKKQMALSHFS